MGEYAVLEGASALVMAVNRRVHLRFAAYDWNSVKDDWDEPGNRSRENATVSPEIALALSLGADWIRDQEWNLAVNAQALNDENGRKLGLGSSSAKAAGAAAFVLQSTDSETLLDLALRSHRAVAPRGSGSDVAACTFGGLVRVEPQRTPKGDFAPPKVSRTQFPAALHWRTYFSGRSASTATLVDAIHAYRTRDSLGHAEAMGSLTQASDDFQQGCLRDDTDRCLQAARLHNATLRELGKQAGTSIVDDAMQTFASRLPVGAAAKPSGAGGGDVAIVFYDDARLCTQIDAEARACGLSHVELSLEEEGPRFE